MGRKAVVKKRKSDKRKKSKWAKALFPYFQEHGVKNVTMDDMAAWLGKSKSTLYEYFVSKEEVLSLSIFSKLEHIGDYNSLLKDSQVPFRDRYANFFALMTAQVPDISTLFLTELREFYPAPWQVVEIFLEDMVRNLGAYYQSGIEVGAFRRISIALLVEEDRHFIFELMSNPEFLKQHNLRIKELVDQYLNLRLNGLHALSDESGRN